MKKRSKIKSSKNIYLLGSSSLFNDIGSEMITPILPFYIAALGGNGLIIGLISGLRNGVEGMIKIFGGWLSDIFGKRKPFVVLGYVISMLFRFFISLANSWEQLLFTISFERFGKLRDAPRDAIISVSTDKRGKGFGISRMMDRSGAIIGTIIVLLLFGWFHFEFKQIILIAALISLITIIPLFFVKEPKFKAIHKNIFRGVKELSSRLKFFIFVAGVFALGNFGVYMFLILRAKEISGNYIFPLFLYTILNVVYAIFAIPFGIISDRIGRKKVLLIGYILFLITVLGFLYSSSVLSLVVLFILFGLVSAIIESNQVAFVSDLSKEMKGTAIGLYHTVVGVVSVPAGLIAGYFWDVSQRFMFGYLSIIAFISIILLSLVKERKY